MSNKTTTHAIISGDNGMRILNVTILIGELEELPHGEAFDKKLDETLAVIHSLNPEAEETPLAKEYVQEKRWGMKDILYYLNEYSPAEREYIEEQKTVLRLFS